MQTLSLFSSKNLAIGLGFSLLILSLCLSASYAGTSGAIRISSNHQTLQMKEGNIHFKGNIKVAMAETQVTGAQANIHMDDNGQPDRALFTDKAVLIKQSGAIKQTVKADTLDMGLQSGSMKANGKVVTKINGDAKTGEVSIQSDAQVFDQEKHIMRAIGHVVVQKGRMRVTSPEAIIFLAPSGTAEKVTFLKGVRLVQGEQEMQAQTITIQVNTGDIFAEKNVESTLVSKDEQGQVTPVKVRSHLQELDQSTGTLLANGNAAVNYGDYTAKGPKAVFYRADEQLDRIVLSGGRSQIEDSERKVVGDIITITVNPKRFNAQGSVTSFIKARGQSTASSSRNGASQSHPETGMPENNTEPSGRSSALDEELMVEKALQESEKQP